MKRVLASLGLGAVIVGGMLHPAIAEDSQRIHAEITKVTSASRQTSSEVTIAGTWSVEKLAVGQFFTVSTEPVEGEPHSRGIRRSRSPSMTGRRSENVTPPR